MLLLLAIVVAVIFVAFSNNQILGISAVDNIPPSSHPVASVGRDAQKNAERAQDNISIALISYNHLGQQFEEDPFLRDVYVSTATISGNGKVVAFVAAGGPPAANGRLGAMVYVYDRTTETVQMITTISSPYKRRVQLSYSGRYVAFGCHAGELANPIHSRGHYCIYDRESQQYVFTLPNEKHPDIVATVSGFSGNGQHIVGTFEMRSLYHYDLHKTQEPFFEPFTDVGTHPIISSNGNYIVYQSFSYGTMNLYDKSTARDEILISPSGSISEYDLSDDGNYFVFDSEPALVEDDRNGVWDIYLYARSTEQLTRISTTPDGLDSDGGGQRPSISGDGRYIVFDSFATNIVADGSIGSDVYRYDRVSDSMEIVSLSSDGEDLRYDSFLAGILHSSQISDDGCVVVFISDGLVDYDVNVSISRQANDVYVRDFCDSPDEEELRDISGRVVDLDGNPIEGVSISVSPINKATTDALGQYTLTGVPTETLTLSAESEYVIITPTVTIPASEDAGTIDFVACYSEKLVEKFRPSMFFHEDEVYRPITVDTPLQHSELVTYSTNLVGGLVRNLVTSAPTRVEDLLAYNSVDSYIDLLGYTSSTHADITSETNLEAYQNFNPSPAQAIYARTYCPRTSNLSYPDIKTVIQYWFFYYDNPWHFPIRHEGDWEMIQVMLDGEQNPIATGYSQHYTGQKRLWQNMRRNSNSPIVYVSRGGHGSFYIDSPISYGGVDDTTTNMESGVVYSAKMLPIQEISHDSWLYFDGHWGSIGDPLNPVDISPQGPRNRIGHDLAGSPSLWRDPIVWFSQLEWYENSVDSYWEKIRISVPIIISLALDEVQNVADINFEVFENSYTDRRTLVIYNPDPDIEYRIPISNIQEQLSALSLTPATLAVDTPNFESNKMIHAEFDLPENWDNNDDAMFVITGKGTINLWHDVDQDSEYDSLIEPKSLVETPIDAISNSDSDVYLPLILR